MAVVPSTMPFFFHCVPSVPSTQLLHTNKLSIYYGSLRLPLCTVHCTLRQLYCPRYLSATSRYNAHQCVLCRTVLVPLLHHSTYRDSRFLFNPNTWTLADIHPFPHQTRSSIAGTQVSANQTRYSPHCLHIPQKQLRLIGSYLDSEQNISRHTQKENLLFRMADITDQQPDQASPSVLEDAHAVGNGSATAPDNRGVKRQRPSTADDDDDDDDKPGRERRKIEIKFIADKSRRHITFSKRKAGIMKKVRAVTPAPNRRVNRVNSRSRTY